MDVYTLVIRKYSAEDERLGAALRTAANQSPNHAGWTLRGAMDAVLHTIHAGEALIKPPASEMGESVEVMTMMTTSTTQYSVDEVAAGLTDAIQTGSRLWNHGDIEACTAIYMAACEK